MDISVPTLSFELELKVKREAADYVETVGCLARLNENKHDSYHLGTMKSHPIAFNRLRLSEKGTVNQVNSNKSMQILQINCMLQQICIK